MENDAQKLAATPGAHIEMTYFEALVQAQMEEMDR
ncbi:MAG: alpha-ketoacid dehydrogenase subunit beta, partial [Mesorhizobium sp.]